VFPPPIPVLNENVGVALILDKPLKICLNRLSKAVQERMRDAQDDD
jgi:hypothetical protein